MDHNSAIENHTAERYLMGELNEAERDAYEEHFFSCAACANEIKSASEFMEGARQVVQAELTSQIYRHAAQGSIWGSWLDWRSMLQPLPAAACLLVVALAGISGYQNSVTIPRLAQMAAPQLIPGHDESFFLGHARDGAKIVNIRKDKSFALRFDIPPLSDAREYGSFEASVFTTQTNVRKFSFQNISLERAKKTVEGMIPAGTLEPGHYTLLIEGVEANGSKGEVDRISFELKFKD